MFLAKCQKSLAGKILTFSIDEGVFGKLKSRLGMIPGRNIKCLRFRRWKVVGNLSIIGTMRALGSEWSPSARVRILSTVRV
ncbi:hypothetical protein E2C01_029502 [Portunus trituberculatus]|uniref:Uncharacterized protein n=1 Tax=Portunus trituberculatus TaxID=210409 RepID=A0A5B7ES21_PORTR|nr:hypothetical protein [Portunus trituberculatus]